MFFFHSFNGLTQRHRSSRYPPGLDRPPDVLVGAGPKVGRVYHGHGRGRLLMLLSCLLFSEARA